LLESKDIDVSPAAATFLREFYGLNLDLPHGGLSAVTFNIHEEMTFLVEGELARLEGLIGQRLCPLGLGGRFLIFMTPSAEMVFLHDEWLLYLRARTIHDGFEVICTPEFKEYETITLSDNQKPPAFGDAG